MTTKSLQDPASAALTASFKDHLASLIGPVATAPVPGWRFMTGPDGKETEKRDRAWSALRANPDIFPIRLPWHFGTELEFQRPSENFGQLFMHRNFDPNEFALLDNILREGMTFLDIGANAGFYTVFAAKKVGLSGEVIAFEPSRRESSTLQRNIAVNKLANVAAFQLAVGETDGKGTLHIAEDRYDGHNALNGLSFQSKPPNLRYTTDRTNFHWTSFNGQRAIIDIGETDQLELLIYSDSPFEFDLLGVSVDAGEARLSPWAVDSTGETPARTPAGLDFSASNALMTTYGGLSLQEAGGGLRVIAPERSGVAFRWRIAPKAPVRILVDGRLPSDAPIEKQSVEIVSLDSFLAGRPLKSVDVIKLDIEGHELPALLGAKGLIDKYKPLLMIEVVNDLVAGKGGALEELSTFLSSRGYACFDVVKGKPRPVDIAGEHGSNVIAAPERFLDAVLTLGGLTRADMATDKAAGSTAPQSNKSNQVRKSA
ncbi:MAG: FkbM family methyltransferase [Amphiplicatus sp.]